MYHHIKFSFLVLILSLICEFHQCSEIRCANNVKETNNQRNMIIEQFKLALINDSDQLFTLQKAFLLPRPSDSQTDGVCVKVIVTMKGRVTENSGYDPSNICSVIDDENGTVCTYRSAEGFELLPATTVALDDFLRSSTIVQMLATLDPSFYYLTGSLFFSGSIILNYDYHYPTYKSYELSLAVDKINEFSDLSRIHEDVTDAVQIALSWAKAYSMNGDNPVGGKLDDISRMKDKCGFYDNNYASASILYNNSLSNSRSTAVLIFIIYLLLNILILMFTVLYLGKMFTWIEQPQHKHLKDLYKASAIVLTFINVAAFISDIFLYVTLQINYDIFILTSYLVIKSFLVVIICISDAVVSCFYTFRSKYSHQWKIMHALALCQFVWFVHRLATDAIISIIEFVIAPAQTVGLISLLLSILVCAILFVSSLLKKCQTCCTSRCTCERNTLPTIFCLTLIAVLTVGLIFAVTLLFKSLVDNGLQSAGIGGFILSLIPPTVILVIGLCANCKVTVEFCHKVLTSSSTTGSANTDSPTSGTINGQTDETTPLNQRLDMEDNEDEL